MSGHNYIAITIEAFPPWTRNTLEPQNISNDGLYYLMPAYDHDGNMVHSPEYIKSKLNVEEIETAVAYITSPENSYTMTHEEVVAARNDPTSIWYKQIDI